MWKTACFSLIPSLLAANVALGEPSRPVVAVLPLVDKTRLPADRVGALSDYLRIRVAALGQYDVVDKGLQEAETRRLVSEAQAASYKECVDEACQIPLGKELAASAILRGSIATFEGTTVLSLELIDVATATSKAAVSERVEGGETSMLSAIERAVEALAGQNEPKAQIFAVLGSAHTVKQTSTPQEQPVLVDIYAMPAPPPDEPSTAAAIIYFTLAAGAIAGGIALDVGPDSAHNGGLDFLDVVPLGLYTTALILGLNGVSEL